MPKEGLYKKLAEVLAEVGRIPKNGRNEHFKYDYVLEADLVDHIRPMLAKRNMVVLPSVEDAAQNGNIFTAKVRFRFIDGDTGEFEDMYIVGAGQDSGDKGYYKAYTGAVKYCLMKTFLVATGDDPERDDDDAPRRKENAKPAPKPVQQAKSQAPIGTPPKSANAEKPAPEVPAHGYAGFWASVKNLGCDERFVHEQAAAYFNVPGLSSLSDIPNLTQEKLTKFLLHLRDIVRAA
jgi:hypothetical protein